MRRWRPENLGLVWIFLVSAMAVAACAEGGGNPSKGKKAFQRFCAACHTVGKGGRHMMGPNLFGVYGAKAGSRGFRRYSSLRDATFLWDDETLDAWLQNPRVFARQRTGTSTMMTGKVTKADDRADLIAYVKTLK